MAYTHYDALSVKNGGYAVGKKGSEVVVIDSSRNISAKRVSTTVSALTPGSTVALSCALGDVFTLTPAQSETINASNISAGQRVAIVVTTSGTNSYDLTFGTGFKSTGALSTGATSGKVFTVSFVSDGTNLNEVARTTAM